MPKIINDVSYLSQAELAEKVGVTRQTLWRWSRQGKIPAGYRFRNKMVFYSPEDTKIIEEFANRIEPIDGSSDGQLTLFNRVPNAKGGG